MKNNKVLIIGGAGFIGSHTADELSIRGYKIRILDNLSPNTHFGAWPKYLSENYEKIEGDVRDKNILRSSLDGVDFIIHLAAKMDLMPEFSEFFDTNVTSTALLYELIVKEKLPIKKVIVASSQFVYGEGRWKCNKDGEVTPLLRTSQQLKKKQWDPLCPKCHGKISYLDNLESHQDPPNQYAISKYSQELIALKIGQQYSIPSVAMRYSIVHGPRQSLKNAYSGALRIFAMKLINGEAPPIFEDGNSLRDYVSVFDVARANADVLEKNQADYENFNVGGTKALSVLELANMIKKLLNSSVSLKANNQFRLGDIRHAVSSTKKLQSLGWKQEMSQEQTIEQYLTWIKKELTERDYYHYLNQAEKTMKQSGVIVSTK